MSLKHYVKLLENWASRNITERAGRPCFRARRNDQTKIWWPQKPSLLRQAPADPDSFGYVSSVNSTKYSWGRNGENVLYLWKLVNRKFAKGKATGLNFPDSLCYVSRKVFVRKSKIRHFPKCDLMPPRVKNPTRPIRSFVVWKAYKYVPSECTNGPQTWANARNSLRRNAQKPCKWRLHLQTCIELNQSLKKNPTKFNGAPERTRTSRRTLHENHRNDHINTTGFFILLAQQQSRSSL